ncbi:MAG: flagellar protein FlaG [Candidatus Pelagadaptatus aseana]|uniref:flagellar protein FlaG n=1 Tax=Candidatus Pelagadaptatus aseana TaxID=3120508 RepID=UPI0039B1E2CB
MNEVNSSNALTAGVRTASSALNQSKSAAVEKATGNQLPQQETEAAAQVDQVDVNQAKVDEAVSKLNDYVQSTQRDLYFAYDDSVSKTVVTVVDRNTEEVVRQIPNEVALTLAARLNEEEPLRLFSAQA